MKNKLNILFIVLNSRKNAGAIESPIYVRITINGKRLELSAGRSVDANKWDSKLQKVKGKSEYAETINTYLHNYKNNIMSTFNSLTLEMGFDAVTTNLLTQRLRGVTINKEHKLMETFQYHVDLMKKGVGVDCVAKTFERYILTQKRLKQFVKNYTNSDDIVLSAVNPEFYDNFQAFLVTNYTCKHNGIVRYLKQLKFIMNKAVSLGWTSRNLIEKCKSAEKPSNRVALNEAELLTQVAGKT